MARNLTPQELVVARAHLMEARDSHEEYRLRHILPVLDLLLDCLGESADLTLLARKATEKRGTGTYTISRGDETTGPIPYDRLPGQLRWAELKDLHHCHRPLNHLPPHSAFEIDGDWDSAGRANKEVISGPDR